VPVTTSAYSTRANATDVGKVVKQYLPASGQLQQNILSLVDVLNRRSLLWFESHRFASKALEGINNETFEDTSHFTNNYNVNVIITRTLDGSIQEPWNFVAITRMLSLLPPTSLGMRLKGNMQPETW